MKKLLLMGAVLLAVLAAAAIIAPHFISADSLKRAIIAQVMAKTNRKLAIDGAVRISFFPVASVDMEQVSLSNPRGFPDNRPFMTLKSLSVDVAVLPLLQRDIEIKSLVLEEPQINLHADKKGLQNWQLNPVMQRPPVSGKPEPSTDTAPIMPIPNNLSLHDVRIKNGTVTFVDDADGTRWGISKLNVSVSLKGISSPFSIDGDGIWNNKPVSVKAKLDTLKTFLSQDRTELEASVKSELIATDIKGFTEKGNFSGKGKIISSSLKGMMSWLDPKSKPVSTPAALALDVNSDMQCSLTACNLPNAVIGLDKLRASGSIRINVAGAKPQLDINLSTDKLDLNAFLPLEQHASAIWPITDAVADSGHWSDAPMDLSLLQAVNATAHIKADSILYRKITFGKTMLQAAIQQGRLAADIEDAETYGGKGSVSVDINSTVSPPAFETRTSLHGVQAEPLLKDADNIERISGTADIDISTTSQGRSQREIVSTLAGKGQLKITNGTIKGVNLANMVQNIQAAFTSANSASQKTAFSEMGGTFTIARGVINNRDLNMKTEGMSLSGQGDINLPGYSIKYRLIPQLTGRSQTGAAATGLGIPVIIEGSLDNPHFRPDLQSAVQDALKDPKQFRENLKNTERSVKDQLKDSKDAIKNLKGLLKGVQGN